MYDSIANKKEAVAGDVAQSPASTPGPGQGPLDAPGVPLLPYTNGMILRGRITDDNTTSILQEHLAFVHAWFLRECAAAPDKWPTAKWRSPRSAKL